jgi:hypothetical protein
MYASAVPTSSSLFSNALSRYGIWGSHFCDAKGAVFLEVAPCILVATGLSEMLVHFYQIILCICCNSCLIHKTKSSWIDTTC